MHLNVQLNGRPADDALTHDLARRLESRPDVRALLADMHRSGARSLNVAITTEARKAGVRLSLSPAA